MAPAELVEDAGAGATADEFFRSAAFIAAEGVTHTLRLGPLAAPVVVRPIPGSNRLDAISPYGYPGLSGETPEALDPVDIDLTATGLVSAFLRHTLGPPPLRDATARNTVLIADPELPPKSRMSDRQQIRKNLKRGYEVDVIPGPQAGPAERDAFAAAYEQTMRRAKAEDRYFFAAEYFEAALSFPSSWLVLAREPGGEVAAGSIAARSDGMLHYFLSGTADDHLRDSPMKNVVARLVELAEEEGMPLNLGGGISEGDALEEFKRGFANRELTFHTSELVCDPAAYEELSAGRDADGFFPAYRAP
jgi:hypothetical protein